MAATVTVAGTADDVFSETCARFYSSIAIHGFGSTISFAEAEPRGCGGWTFSSDAHVHVAGLALADALKTVSPYAADAVANPAVGGAALSIACLTTCLITIQSCQLRNNTVTVVEQSGFEHSSRDSRRPRQNSGGGAVAVSGASGAVTSLVINSTTMSMNRYSGCSLGGGALLVMVGDGGTGRITVVDSNFTSNYAAVAGGALALVPTLDLDHGAASPATHVVVISDSVFVGNVAGDGDGLGCAGAFDRAGGGAVMLQLSSALPAVDVVEVNNAVFDQNEVVALGMSVMRVLAVVFLFCVFLAPRLGPPGLA
jgi:hypothetical protein